MSISPHVLILAAGKGKRMVSALPKVLHPVLFRPMVHYVIDLAKAMPHETIRMVVGHGETEVREACGKYPEVEFLLQKEQRGTGHAVRMAEPALGGKKGHVVILSGDVILLRPASLAKLIQEHESTGAACTLTSARLSSPHGYGRVLRRTDGAVCAIREERDCSEAERRIDEVNAGIYIFEIAALFSALAGISDQNAQKEFYLTDAVANLVSGGRKVSAVVLADPMEMAGINDRRALWEVEQVLQGRVNDALMLSGVAMRDPSSIFIDTLSRIAPDCAIEAGCQIIESSVARGAIIESGCRLVKSEIAEGAHVKQGSYIEKSTVGPESTVGPYAHLRPGSVLGRSVKIGNFVELKNATMKDGAKASHLAYIGDAEVGKNSNLGCGFITCNYDGGPVKHKTMIHDNVFVGSDSQTVAPVTLGEGSYVASGSTVTRDVPPGALAFSRGRQVNKDGYVARLKARKGIKES